MIKEATREIREQ